MPDQTVTAEELRERDLGLRALGFLLDEVATGIAGLPPVDALIVLAINQANIAPLTREPLSRIRYGGLRAPAPDARRRAVSMNAVAASLRLPFETVRRRVHALAARGVCAVTETGLIVPETFLASPGYLATVEAGHWRLMAFFREIRAQGWFAELPPSGYPPEDSVPIHAAARLLADYVLRTTSKLIAMAGGVSPSVVLLAIAAEAREPTPAAALARRLAMPSETARRQANRLAERGLCRRLDDGFAIDEATLSLPAWRTLFHENAVDLHRLFSALAERGVVEAWGRLTPPQFPAAGARARS